MKKITVKLTALMLCLTLFGSPAAMGVNAAAEELKMGDIITFGSYPQSEVKDEALLEALNAQTLNWVSYGYYSGSGNPDGTMTAKDYMKYADVAYNGERYRAVTFSLYRGTSTAQESVATPNGNNSYQYTNGYLINQVYWFKYEPISWRVLDGQTGLLMCESLIDSQPFTNYVNATENIGYYDYGNGIGKAANDWETSSIRQWLNNDFYNLAFTKAEKASVTDKVNDNRCSQTSSYYESYNRADTTEKVYLLSTFEVCNADYGFNPKTYEDDPARLGKGTDYAKCQGLIVSTYAGTAYTGCSYWWLRNNPGNTDRACNTYTSGSCGDAIFAYHVGAGVRPAITLNPDYCLQHSMEVAEEKAPTCTEDGYITRRCTDCDYEETEVIPATHAEGHLWDADYTVDKEPTYTEEGSESIHCACCSETKNNKVLPKKTGQITVKANRSEIGYKNTASFSAVTDVTDGKIVWYDAQRNQILGEGITLTTEALTDDITVFATVSVEDMLVAESDRITVTVKNGLFDRIRAFFAFLLKKFIDALVVYC